MKIAEGHIVKKYTVGRKESKDSYSQNLTLQHRHAGGLME
jgi:hypothetical protein